MHSVFILFVLLWLFEKRTVIMNTVTVLVFVTVTPVDPDRNLQNDMISIKVETKY